MPLDIEMGVVKFLSRAVSRLLISSTLDVSLFLSPQPTHKSHGTLWRHVLYNLRLRVLRIKDHYRQQRITKITSPAGTKCFLPAAGTTVSPIETLICCRNGCRSVPRTPASMVRSRSVSSWVENAAIYVAEHFVASGLSIALNLRVDALNRNPRLLNYERDSAFTKQIHHAGGSGT